MARRKKQEAGLFPSERLARALVPPEEQPYPVPENWRWVRLSQLISASKEKTDDFSDSFVKYVGLEHMEKDGGIVACGTVEDIKSLKSIFKKGQILYGKLRPYLNKHDIATFDGVCSTDILVFDAKEITLNLFVNYFFDQHLFIEYVISNSKGINLPRVSEAIVLNAVCPLPPLAEQQRIVSRIESLFAKLDEAREKAQVVVDGFKNRKAAILHKAFTGELTKKWREENKITREKSWKYGFLGDYADSQYGYTEKSSSEDVGPKFLRITDIQNGQVIWRDVPYCKIDNKQRNKYSLNVGDIVIARTGATTGKSYMIIDKIDAVYASYLIRITIKNKFMLNSKYLYHFLDCPMYWQQITEFSSGIAQPGVNGNKLKKMNLPVPSPDEQNKIVDILDRMLSIERHVKELAEQVLESIDAMKKAILARAFRGELGTNDPADESAEALLKRIL